MGTGRRKSCPVRRVIHCATGPPSGAPRACTRLVGFRRDRGLYCCRLFSCYYRPAGDQPFPGGLVVRIRRSHRRGPGSIPAELSKAPGCGDIISAYQLSAARLLAKNGFRRRKTCGPFEAGSKEEPAFPYRESNPGRLGDQPFPGGLVVRIRRSHRAAGFDSRSGNALLPPNGGLRSRALLALLRRPSPSKTKGVRVKNGLLRASDLRIANSAPTVLRSTAELSKAPGCGDIISAYQLSAARLLAKNGFRRRKTCGPFEAGSKEEPAFPYRESNPGRLGENQES
ncbi:hypothetical protein QQF64_003181 [Cirrhinus molitorella]|uniref:Uncharacterized protein n=1 Tax=Cirrhinus molitorella TaxID=172907 RepID=A0ABR3MKT0_9TELE